MVFIDIIAVCSQNETRQQINSAEEMSCYLTVKRTVHIVTTDE
jgi:hypothetical protein